MPSWYVMIACTFGAAVLHIGRGRILFVLVTGSFRNLSVENKQNDKAPRFLFMSLPNLFYYLLSQIEAVWSKNKHIQYNNESDEKNITIMFGIIVIE